MEDPRNAVGKAVSTALQEAGVKCSGFVLILANEKQSTVVSTVSEPELTRELMCAIIQILKSLEDDNQALRKIIAALSEPKQ